MTVGYSTVRLFSGLGDEMGIRNNRMGGLAEPTTRQHMHYFGMSSFPSPLVTFHTGRNNCYFLFDSMYYNIDHRRHCILD